MTVTRDKIMMIYYSIMYSTCTHKTYVEVCSILQASAIISDILFPYDSNVLLFFLLLSSHEVIYFYFAITFEPKSM